ncbi:MULTISPECIES: glycosyltransferase family 2 protein [unclassified Polaromonas]|jgi:glycosyltransferase involved in cell wall biosynthesis|uniref:glycosyltransferase family 2 protein n=1 Tax=unclassified Polaromonas TaxID=2638319 RepID=UPI000BC9D1CE|nr:MULTISPECIES: glycosyltransferase family 2 protein [unclassified Polaromonas]OYZ76261.1 MAG: hypothetical protein B7Y09_21130 [Polaromonas sp. 24-63-21]OZA47481.1 MAG: hypothetical protein B7X88_21840 [Polaromonas sp. 17-63-33]
MNSPLISIVVAVFNGAQTIQKCIDSIQSQDFKNFELIVIDGESTDSTCEILHRNKNIIKYMISESDRGIADAWNKGISQAKGEWIYFLGADDYLWDSGVLSAAAKELQKNSSNALVVYGKVAVVNEEYQEIVRAGKPWHQISDGFKGLMLLPHQGIFHHYTLFKTYGHFDEQFRIVADYEFLLRYLKSNKAIFLSNLTVSGMLHGGISSQADGSLRLLREVRQAQKKCGLNMPHPNWILAMMRVRFRLLLTSLLGEQLTYKILDQIRALVRQPRFWTKL